MNPNDEQKLKMHIRFPISEVYGNSYSVFLPTVSQTNFKLNFSNDKNKLSLLIQRDTLNLACFSISISSHPYNLLLIKSSIRFNKGQKEYRININDSESLINDSFYEMNIQIEQKKFNSVAYKKTESKENTNKQTNLKNFFLQTTEDYVGIPNQGATCYLNSLLQVLFHIKKFRKLIYDLKVEKEESNFIFCLQLLFRDIQLRKYRRGTQHLTNSLGWDKEAVCSSQDVSEFYKFLFESVLKEESLTSIFEGEYEFSIMNNFSEVVEKKKEKFIQLMVNVEGFGNLLDSMNSLFFPISFFDEKTKEERIRQLNITKMPKVLALVLKRFWFNDKAKQYEKLNSIMTFPEIFDLNEIGVHLSTNSKYQLFAAIAHIGTMNMGHYVAFVNPDLKGKWYEFNDNKVFSISKENTFDLCYGMNRMNAYMLFFCEFGFQR